jgi:beta-xylosidase
VFSKRLMITDGVQVGGYNYGQLDETLDFLVQNNIRPWLDLSNRPFTAVKGEGKTVFFEYQCVEFQSREAWEAMVWDFLRHVVKRYGRDEVNQWIFELCCDRAHPEECALYRDEEHPYEFFEAYRYFYRTVKEFAPMAQAGGPGIITKFDTQFNRGFLLRCVEEGCKPDFISFLMFPYAEEFGEDGTVVSRRQGNKNAEQEQVAYMRELMQETDTQDCLLYACEWNNSLSNRSFLNDSSYRSAYIARTVNQLWDEVDMGCIRMASDIVGSYYDTYRVANGNMGLVTVGDIRKPAYFAFQFLHSLGAYLVDRGEGYLITRTAHGRFFILCYNYKWFGSSYFLRKEYETSPSDVKGLFEDDDPLELELVLEGLSNHTDYFVNRQVISCWEGSLLHEWSNFQYEDTPESRAYLKQVCFPRMSMVKRPVRNHQLKIQEKLQANEVSLLYICANN